jgi:hypothetical protein
MIGIGIVNPRCRLVSSFYPSMNEIARQDLSHHDIATLAFLRLFIWHAALPCITHQQIYDSVI